MLSNCVNGWVRKVLVKPVDDKRIVIGKVGRRVNIFEIPTHTCRLIILIERLIGVFE